MNWPVSKNRPRILNGAVAARMDRIAAIRNFSTNKNALSGLEREF